MTFFSADPFLAWGDAPSLPHVSHHADTLTRVADSLLRLPAAEAGAESLERIHSGACRLYRWSAGGGAKASSTSTFSLALAQIEAGLVGAEGALAGQRAEDWRIELGLRDLASCRSALASVPCGR